MLKLRVRDTAVFALLLLCYFTMRGPQSMLGVKAGRAKKGRVRERAGVAGAACQRDVEETSVGGWHLHRPGKRAATLSGILQSGS